jgi:hypothetical protein
MESRGCHPDESSHPPDPVRCPAAAPGRLPVGRSLPASVAIAGDGAAIPAIISIIPRPWGWCANRAAAILPVIRATVIRGGPLRGACGGRAASPAAAIRGGPAATARTGSGVDSRLLELGRPLGVGTGTLPPPALCPRRVGAGSVALPTRRLGVGRRPLAPVGAGIHRSRRIGHLG